MATLSTQPLATPEKRDFRQEVTDRIIDMLETGIAPWQKPWEPSASSLGMPSNPTTDNAYRGGNAIHLMATALRRGYDDTRWTTYKQASDQGWKVRKGEKGTQIEYWEIKPASREKANDPAPDGDSNRESVGDHGRNGRLIHRVYTVFNAKQIDGVPAYKPKEHTSFEVVHAGEQILANSGAKISHDQADRAFYRRASDSIHLPPKDAFQDAAGYYGTALHELAHWTGHPARLNRPTLNDTYRFGDTNYAREELRAELASVFLAAERGIPHNPEQHAAYVGSWIAALKKDKNEIFRAAHDASAASDYLLALERDRSIADQVLSASPVLDATNGSSRVAVLEQQTTVLDRSREDLDETAIFQQLADGAAEPRNAPTCSFLPGDRVMAHEPYHYGGKPRKDPWVPGVIRSLYNNNQYISYARGGDSENGNKAVEYAMKGEMRYPTAQEQERYSLEFSQLENKVRPDLARLSKAVSYEPGSPQESSHYVSRYEPGRATIHTEHKATGTDRRITFDTSQLTNSHDPTSPQGQSIDTAKGNGATDSLTAARAITASALGDSASMFAALTDSGTYRGVVLGETEHHIVQRQSDLSSVLHQKDSLNERPEAGANVVIQYSNEKATFRKLRERVKTNELSR